MYYYSIYLKGIQNGTGYIDIVLKDDQLMRDYLQYLDIGMRAHRAYTVVDPGSALGSAAGIFSINIADIAAITTTAPAAASGSSQEEFSATQFIRPADVDDHEELPFDGSSDDGKS